jgi:hypothetical protein
MTKEKAQDAAVCDGQKIKHRFFEEHEYIFWSKGKWYTEDGFELPNDYWRKKNESFEKDWVVLK